MKHFTIIIPSYRRSPKEQELFQRLADLARIFAYQIEILLLSDCFFDIHENKDQGDTGDVKITVLKSAGISLKQAIIQGVCQSSTENLVIMKGDLTHEPENIPALITPLLENRYDMVIGNRFPSLSNINIRPYHKKLTTKILNLPVQILTGMEDPFSDFIAVKREFITRYLPNTSKQETVEDVTPLKRIRFRVKETPIDLANTSQTSSTPRMIPLLPVFLYWRNFYQKNHISSITGSFLTGILPAAIDGLLFYMLLRTGLDYALYHFISFLSAGLLYLSLCRYNKKNSSFTNISLLKRRKAWMIFILLLPYLFLRGGLLTMLIQADSSPPAIAVTLSLSTYVTLLVYTLLSPALSKDQIETFTPSIAIPLIILYSLLLRAVYLGSTDLIQEEAYYWTAAQHLNMSMLSSTSMVEVLIFLTCKLAGNTEFAIRTSSFLCWFVTAIYSYFLSKNLFGSREAIFSVLLVAVLPIFFGSALVMTPDAPLLACWSAVLYYSYSACVKQQEKAWIGVCIGLCLGILTKGLILLLLPACLLYLFVNQSSRKILLKPWPYLSFGVPLLIAVLSGSAELDHSQQPFFPPEFNPTEGNFSSPTLLTSAIIFLITPGGIVAFMISLFPHVFQHSREKWKNYQFNLIMMVVPFTSFILISFFLQIKFYESGPIFLMVLPVMSHIIVFAIKNRSRFPLSLRLLFSHWTKVSFALLCFYGAILHYLSLGLPWIPHLKNNILIGWDDLALKIERIVVDIEKATEQKTVVVGMDRYRITSGISFYGQRDKQKSQHEKSIYATGRHLFGQNSRMFSYWHPYINFSHMNIVAIAQSPDMLNTHFFTGKAMKIGKIRRFIIVKNGRKVTPFYYRVLEGYLPGDQRKVVKSSIN